MHFGIRSSKERAVSPDEIFESRTPLDLKRDLANSVPNGV
jgi:hypothetical protein